MYITQTKGGIISWNNKLDIISQAKVFKFEPVKMGLLNKGVKAVITFSLV